ncbi:uncharacterized protein EV420DRAFT_1577036 [Desarmillaria tabescens]|uniref:Uncharacterized protein n=1 Tax=Armillaria tabescens TaxID=1929756 RepID=A0AA39JI90_ARMTA|nr:uncharacterized protein EV420DRAFT_1577036 [Desarmillaria tabescens]KAK0443123.1 hypothetical protein EV420DRAFT_1577036 [Desarmillaria tabescens]
MARSVLLTVRIIYLPPKAAIFIPEDLEAAIVVLRADLTSLRIPHPKAYTIKILSPGVVRFCWETEMHSTLHTQLSKRIPKLSQGELFKRAISKMSLKQEPGKKLDPPPQPNIKYLLPQHVPDSVFGPQGFVPILESSLGGSAPSESSSSAQIISADSSYPQYAGSECSVPTSGTAEPYPDELETLSRLQSPVSRCTSVKEEATSVVIGKRTSCSLFSPSPAKRYRSRSPSNNDEFSLLHELGSLSEEIKYLAAKQSRIREKLQDLGVSSIPEPDFLSRNQIRDLELEIETERRQRIECETVLMDIRRECRVPFIVPALFDAFIDISKLTTTVVDSLH